VALNTTTLAHSDAVWGGRQPLHLVWDWADTKEEFGKIESPIWLDRTILSGGLIIYMVGVVVWFW